MPHTPTAGSGPNDKNSLEPWRGLIDDRLDAGDSPGRVAFHLEKQKPCLGKAFIDEHRAYAKRPGDRFKEFDKQSRRYTPDAPIRLQNGVWCHGPPRAEHTGMNRPGLLQLARNNAEIALQNVSVNPYHTLTWFRDQVRNKGPWDFKQRHPSFQNFGNYHFGYVGASLGIPDSLLLRQAGKAQQGAKTSRPDWGSPGNGIWGGTAPYGDDPLDQIMIRRGIEDRKRGC